MNIYVGNLADATQENDLLRAFEKFGEVLSVRIIKEPSTGSPRGFGFVEMYEREAAAKAIGALNGSTLCGKQIVVNEAKPKQKSGR